MKKPRGLAFTTYCDGLKDVLTNEAQVAAAYTPPGASSAPRFKKYNSIWDTGATNTVITKRVSQDCHLKAIAMTRVRGVHGIKMASLCLINIRLPNELEISKLQVTEAEELSSGADVLIGMDIIGRGDFAVSNYRGNTTFTFRHPSLEQIDFLAKG